MRIVRLLAWVSAAVVLMLSLSPPRYRTVTVASRDLEHFAAFALVGLLFALAYPQRHLKLVGVGIVAIAAIELAQIVVPGRHAYLTDFVLNVLGYGVGLASARILVRASP